MRLWLELVTYDHFADVFIVYQGLFFDMAINALFITKINNSLSGIIVKYLIVLISCHQLIVMQPAKDDAIDVINLL